MPTTADLLARLDGLQDLSRLRLLMLLESGEFGVGELAAAIQMPQSTVSRHLKRLTEGGWVSRRSLGTQARYRLQKDQLDEPARALWEVARATVAADPRHEEDQRRAREVLATRRTDSREFFGSMGASWTALRRHLFGEASIEHALIGLLDPTMIVADLGCGTGQMAVALAPWVGRIEAVDREPAMLDAARARLADVSNVVFHACDMTELPMADHSVDAAVISLVLHHAPEPVRIVQEAARVLAPAGRLLIVDMVRHDRTDYRDTMGHLHLGFDRDSVDQWAHTARMHLTRWTVMRPDPQADGPSLFAALLQP